MKLTLIVRILLPLLLGLSGCSLKPPNIDLGFTDSPGEANFAYTIQGDDFKVDNSGHNYTLHGQNLSYDQMRDLFFYMSPWAWGDMKNFLLNYCHQNPGACTYSTVKTRFDQIESNMKSKMRPEHRALFESIMGDKKIELRKQIEKYDSQNY